MAPVPSNMNLGRGQQFVSCWLNLSSASLAHGLAPCLVGVSGLVGLLWDHRLLQWNWTGVWRNGDQDGQPWRKREILSVRIVENSECRWNKLNLGWRMPRMRMSRSQLIEDMRSHVRGDGHSAEKQARIRGCRMDGYIRVQGGRDRTVRRGSLVPVAEQVSE